MPKKKQRTGAGSCNHLFMGENSENPMLSHLEKMHPKKTHHKNPWDARSNVDCLKELSVVLKTDMTVQCNNDDI